MKVLLEESQSNGRTVDRGIDLLQTMMRNEAFVNSFDLDDYSTGTSLDKAILYSLIKCSTSNPIDQLMIALKFGGIEGIKEKILAEGANSLRTSVDISKLFLLSH